MSRLPSVRRAAVSSLRLASALVALVLCSCGAGGRQSVDNSPGPQPIASADQLPGLPQEEPGSARATSVNLNLMLDGDEFLDTNTQAIGEGELVLAPNEPGVGPLAWATYRFSGVAADFTPSTLSVGLSGMAAGEEYYFALADYALGGWQVIPVTADGPSGTFGLLDYFSGPNNISSLGNLHVAVLTYNLSLTIEFLSLQGNGSLTAPQNFAASDLASPNEIVLTWDLVPGAEKYEVFYKEAGQPDEFYGFLSEAGDNDGRGYFQHTENIPIGKPAVFGTVYEYKVRAVAGGEDPSPFSNPDTGTRGYEAPYFLEASDQAYEDHVLLLWFADTGAEESEWSYGIVRDDVLFDIVTVTTGGGGWYLDTTVSDFAEHEYRVYRGSPEVGYSDPSPADTGSRGKWEHTTILAVDTGDRTLADIEVSPEDPTVPAIAYFLENLTSLYYGGNGPASFHLVAQAGMYDTMELTIFDGRPWIAYSNYSPVYGTLGVKLARGKVSAPRSMDDWDVYNIYDCSLYGGEIAMEVIGGRLAMLFNEDLGGGETQLHYAYPTVDDPQSANDWVISSFGEFTGVNRPKYFDIADRGGFPVAVYQNIGGIALFEGSTVEPAGPQDWTEYPVNRWWDPGNASGVDLSFHDGQAYIAYCEGGFESPGQTVMTYTLNWPPAAEDWFHSSIADFNDEEVKGASLQFHNGRPWVSWSHSGDSTPTVASHVYRNGNNRDGNWGAGLWLYQPLFLQMSYTESRNETTLIQIGGSLGLLYVVNNASSENPWELRYAKLLPPEVAP